MSIFFGIVLTIVTFFAVVVFLNILMSVTGAAEFNPNYKAGIERRYPRLSIGGSLLVIMLLGILGQSTGLLGWFLIGVFSHVVLAVGTLAYLHFFE